MSDVDDQISLSDGQLSDYGSDDKIELRSSNVNFPPTISPNETTSTNIIDSESNIERKNYYRNSLPTRKRSYDSNGNSNGFYQNDKQRQYNYNEPPLTTNRPRYINSNKKFEPPYASNENYEIPYTSDNKPRYDSPYPARRSLNYTEPSRRGTSRNGFSFENRRIYNQNNHNNYNKVDNDGANTLFPLDPINTTRNTMGNTTTNTMGNNTRNTMENYKRNNMRNNSQDKFSQQNNNNNSNSNGSHIIPSADAINELLSTGGEGLEQLLKVVQYLAAESSQQLGGNNIHESLMIMLHRNDFEKLSNTLFGLCEQGFNPSPQFIELSLHHPDIPVYLLRFLYEKFVSDGTIPNFVCDLISRRNPKYDELIEQIFYDHKHIFNGFPDNNVAPLFKIFKRVQKSDAILDFIQLRSETKSLNSRVIFEALLSLRDDMFRLSALVSLTYDSKTPNKVHLKTHTFLEIVQCFIHHPDINQPPHFISLTNYLKMIRYMRFHLTPENLNVLFSAKFDLINERFLLDTVMWLKASNPQIGKLTLPRSKGFFAQCVVRHFHIYCLSDVSAEKAVSLLPVVLSIDQSLFHPDILNFWISRSDNLNIPEDVIENVKRMTHRLSFRKRSQGCL